MYEVLGKVLPGRVAAKVYSGEAWNQNYLHPEFWKPMIESLKATVVECNTACPPLFAPQFCVDHLVGQMGMA